MNPRSKNMSWPNCDLCYEHFMALDPCRGLISKDHVQEELDAAKPWIGMYIAAASALSGIAMAVDVFNGFKTKQIWFPCKYFSLNATSSTLLAVAMKLTMDLTSTRLDTAGTIASYSTVVLLSSAMGHFMTSLASMNDNEIMLNLTALGILVITVVINVCLFEVQLGKAFGISAYYFDFDEIVGGFLLLLLIMLCISAIIAPTTKTYIETKFWEMHKKVLNERVRVRDAKYTARDLTEILKIYWVMSGTGNPQFVMARSAICVIPGVICLSMTLTLLVLGFEANNDDFFHSHSVYKWSFPTIVIIQTMGAIIGTAAPIFRLFVAARIKSSTAGLRSFKEHLKSEIYWTQRLINWRESPLPLRINGFKFKKILHISKRVLLNIFIKLHIMIVLASRLILIISSLFIYYVSFKFIHHVNHESRAASTNELDFSPYVLLLEGELELPNKIIGNIADEAHKLIQTGKMRKPKNVVELLQKSANFNGVRDVDRKNITSLHVQEPRNNWSLSVVTLTSIAIALPNISSDVVNKLFSSVSEGLPFVKFIEKKFDTSGELRSIRKTADIMWVQLELDHKWQNDDIVQGNNMNVQTYKDTLLELSVKAEKTVINFKTSTTDSVMDNPLNWPTEVIAANSMYRICESLLLIENDGTTTHFFKRLSIIISDILAACLTNLAHVLFTECYINSIEKTQESIRRALILLGESEEIIQCLEQREWPNLDPDKAGYIEEWQAIMERGNDTPANSVSTSDDSSAPQSSNGQVVIIIGSRC